MMLGPTEHPIGKRSNYAVFEHVFYKREACSPRSFALPPS